jgi:Zn-dependent protease
MLLELFLSNKHPVFAILTICLVLLSVSIHEFSHALAATLLGDQTPRYTGRLTLNPFAHFDVMGLFFILFTRFGWGKPVQIDPTQLKNPKRDMALISFAGPFSNIVFGFVIILMMKLADIFLSGIVGLYVIDALMPVVYITFGLAIFNLLPISPLDGEKIFIFFIPEEIQSHIETFMRTFSFIILLMILVPIIPGGYSVFTLILSPIYLLIDTILSFLGLL